MANNDNIIYAKFNHGREITTDSRSQYAYGQVLKISGLHLPASFDADVSNKGDKQAKAAIGTNNELPIDDNYFLSGKDIIVMINVHATDKDGRTKYIINIPIDKRSKRADIELEPVEQDVVSTAIATLNEAVERTSADVESAENSANRAHESAVSAEQSATNASNSETLVKQYAERAETAAESSEKSETNAKASEESAKQSESHAEQIANDIEQFTERAETASRNAESSATIATEKASEILESAYIATTKADEASSAATYAGEAANSASTSANNAELNAQKTQSDREVVELAKSDVMSAVDNAQNYAESAQTANQAIQDMNVKAVTLDVGSDVTVEKTVDPESGAVTLTYGIPKGIKGDKGDTGNKGDKGDPFVFSDFTPEQLASLKGEKGDKGDQGIQGEQGVQGEQGIQGLKGDTGDKGEKGDAFTYADFTPEQLASLKGEKGDKGDTGASGKDGANGKDGINGTDGISPTVSITTIAGGHRITITDTDGQHSADVMDGNDYVLTAQDKADIAGLVDVPVTDAVPTQGSTNAVSSGGVYSALHDTDTTLSQSGQAADAKVVGDKITDLKADLTNLQSIVWTQGYINAAGTIKTGPDRYYSNLLICPPNTSVSYVAETNHTNIMGISFYDMSGTFISGVVNNGEIGTEMTVTSPDGCAFCRLSTRQAYKDKSYYNIATQGIEYIVKSLVPPNGNKYLSFVTNGTNRSLINTNVENILTATVVNSDYLIALYYEKDGVIANSGWVTSVNVNTINATTLYWQLRRVDNAVMPSGILADVVEVTRASDLVTQKDMASTGYVSKSGSDSNSGLSRAYALLTISSAINKGYKNIIIGGGTYAESLTLTNISRLHMSLDMSGNNFSATENPNNPKVIIDGGNSNTNGIVMTDCYDCTFEGIEVCNFTRTAWTIDNCSGITFIDCVAHDIAIGQQVGGGYMITDSNVNFYNCDAYNIGTTAKGTATYHLDGFNIHNTGTVNLYDCNAYNCEDDGVSHHDACCGTIDGGEWYNCGKGGVASPTHGAKVNIKNVYSHDNAFGIYAGNETTLSKSVLVSGCVFKDNTHDIFANNNTLNVWNCLFDTQRATTSGVINVIS